MWGMLKVITRGTIPQLVEGIHFPLRPDPDAYYNFIYSTIIGGGQKGQQTDQNLNTRACVDILGYLYIPPSTYLHTQPSSHELF